MRNHLFLCPLFLLLSVTTALGQTQCFRTCAPDPGSPTYGGNIGAQSQPRNARGMGTSVVSVQKAGASTTVLGSSSYSYSIPILHLPGRAGLDLDLNLYYNSDIWAFNVTNNSVTFNADRDWPSY